MLLLVMLVCVTLRINNNIEHFFYITLRLIDFVVYKIKCYVKKCNVKKAKYENVHCDEQQLS